ncbi:MAG: MauE/DoxX family redox-associated membrane protein [Thermodesulfobacteriota bacterium]
MASLVLGLIFLVAGLGKLPVQTDAYTILLTLPRSPVLVFLSDYVHIVFPVLEIALGLLLILGIAARAVAVGSAALVAAFIFNNLWLIGKELATDPCYCFGGSLNWLLGVISVKEALYIDVAMLGLICLIVTRYPGRWFGLKPWFLRV